MKIKSIDVWRKNLGSKRPYTIAFKTVSDVDCVFVKITLENGIFGLGAANPSEQVVGESIEDTYKALGQENLDFLQGADIRTIEGLLKKAGGAFYKTPAAHAAVDIALYDAFTKFLDIPLVSYFGQEIKSLPTTVTIGIKNVTETLEEAEEYYGLGFRYLKVKTGNEVNEDAERVIKLREKYGDEIAIRVDANQGYDANDLKIFCQKTDKHSIELIEQPFPGSEVGLMREQPKAIQDIIAADESLLSPKDAFLLAQNPRACGIFNIKLMKSGGIFPAKQIATIADKANIDLMWGCNDESAISIAAALHVALSCANTKYLDLDGSLDLMTDIVSGGFQIKDGWMTVSPGAGLGLQPLDLP